jgi:hypothetical protein
MPLALDHRGDHADDEQVVGIGEEPMPEVIRIFQCSPLVAASSI